MGRRMASLAGGTALKQLATDNPYMEAIRYEHKNVKWTFHHIDYFADALATGIIETGIAPGDVVLSWLPLHFAEQVSHYQLELLPGTTYVSALSRVTVFLTSSSL